MTNLKNQIVLNNFIIRTLSGAVFGVVVLGSIWAGAMFVAAMLLVVIVWSMLEFYNIVIKDRVRTSKFLGILSGVLIFLGGFFYAQGDVVFGRALFLSLIPLIVMIFITQLYSNQKNDFRAIAYTITGIIYIAAPVTMLASLMFIGSAGKYSHELLLGFLILLWANDSFAYLTGIIFGRRRLFERISPKKSVEGFIGGLVCTVGISILTAYFLTIIPYYHWIAIAVIIVVFGVFGDLVESLLKRNLKIKDSGKFLPGHGGILDRFDSVFIAAPMVFVYLMVFVY